MRRTDAELMLLVEELSHCNGGPLHIATEDYNLDDDHIAFCYKAAHEWPEEPIRTIGIAVAHELLLRSVQERAALFGFSPETYESYHSYESS